MASRRRQRCTAHETVWQRVCHNTLSSHLCKTMQSWPPPGLLGALQPSCIYCSAQHVRAVRLGLTDMPQCCTCCAGQ